VEVEGTPQELHPILRDEVYRIAGEGLRNAFRHARARRIEVESGMDERELRVRIRDDGSGIDASVRGHEGRAEHWGLPGMRERAQRIGGTMDLWSELGAARRWNCASLPPSLTRHMPAEASGCFARRRRAYEPRPRPDSHSCG